MKNAREAEKKIRDARHRTAVEILQIWKKAPNKARPVIEQAARDVFKRDKNAPKDEQKK